MKKTKIILFVVGAVFAGMSIADAQGPGKGKKGKGGKARGPKIEKPRITEIGRASCRERV